MTSNGHCFSWGINRFGQLGTGMDPLDAVFHNPERVKFGEGSRVIKLCCGSGNHHFAQMEDQSWFSLSFLFFFKIEDCCLKIDFLHFHFSQQSKSK